MGFIHIALVGFLWTVSAGVALAQSLPQAWVSDLVAEAVDRGVDPNVAARAMASAQIDPRVVELDQRQPEKTITFATYQKGVLTPARIKKGAALARQNHEALARASAAYGVPPAVIVALWGIESSFGQNTGSFPLIDSLATLAYEGRRAAFFRNELIAALKIAETEGLDVRGSWAGALGQCQFMPSTYLRYAADGDGDGRRDIWRNRADVFASIARYLAAEGWKPGVTWGREVRLTKPLDPALIGLDHQEKLASWSQRGVRDVRGQKLAQVDLNASLIQPDGVHGRSFLVYDNFRSLMRWNRSTYFATSVGLLADKISAKKH